MMFVAVVLSESLAAQGPKKKLLQKNVLLVAYTVAIVFTTVVP
jgi:hypothetical protein